MTLEARILEIESLVSKVSIEFQHNVLGRKTWFAKIKDRETHHDYIASSFESPDDALTKVIERWRNKERG